MLERHVSENNLGVTFAAETGFLISTEPDTVRAPDVAFLTAAKWAAIEDETGYLPVAPDLVAEVVSPKDSSSAVEAKVQMWLETGVQLVLVVDPEVKSIRVYRDASRIDVLHPGDTLDAGEVVAGWKLDVAHWVAGVDPPFLARDLEDVAEHNEIAFDGCPGDRAQTLVAPAGDVDAADPGDDALGEGLAHEHAQPISLGLRAFLQRRDLGEIALEQLLERGRFGLRPRDERTLVHLDLDGPRPLLGLGAGLERLGLCRLALPADLRLPLMGAAFSEGGHRHTPLVRERV